MCLAVSKDNMHTNDNDSVKQIEGKVLFTRRSIEYIHFRFPGPKHETTVVSRSFS